MRRNLALERDPGPAHGRALHDYALDELRGIEALRAEVDAARIELVREEVLVRDPSHPPSTLACNWSTPPPTSRKAILKPENDVIHRGYAPIRKTLRTERDGQALKLVRYTTDQDNIDEARYRAVL